MYLSMSSRNGGSPPLLAPGTSKASSFNLLDLEQAMNDATREISVAEPEPGAVEVSEKRGF